MRPVCSLYSVLLTKLSRIEQDKFSKFMSGYLTLCVCPEPYSLYERGITYVDLKLPLYEKKISLNHSGLQDDLKNTISFIVEMNNGYISGRSYLFFSLSIFSSLYLMSLIYFGETWLICSLRKSSRIGLMFMNSVSLS